MVHITVTIPVDRADAATDYVELAFQDKARKMPKCWNKVGLKGHIFVYRKYEGSCRQIKELVPGGSIRTVWRNPVKDRVLTIIAHDIMFNTDDQRHGGRKFSEIRVQFDETFHGTRYPPYPCDWQIPRIERIRLDQLHKKSQRSQCAQYKQKYHATCSQSQYD